MVKGGDTLFWDRLINIFNNTNDEKALVSDESIGLNPSIEEMNNFFNRNVIVGGNLSSATYYSCMQIRCNSFAKLPIKLMKWNSGGSEKAEGHPLYELFRLRPNPYMSVHDFLWATEFMKLHYGNAFWVPEFNKDKITALYLLDSRNVQILIDNRNLLGGQNYVYYIYTDAKNGMLIYRSDDICHFKNFSLNGIEGTSVSKYIYETVMNENLSNNFMNHKYSTGLQNPLIVQYAGDLGDAMQSKIKRKFSEMGGVKNAGKVIPIPADFKIDQLETKLVDNQFFELQGLTSRHIANAFGIKGFQLNYMEKSTYNNVEQQNKAYYSDTLQNVLTAYEQEMNYKLLTKMEQKSYYWKFNVDSVLRSDLTARSNSYASGITNGYMTIAEVREKEDLPYIDGTDRLIIGNGAAVFLDDVGKWKGGV